MELKKIQLKGIVSEMARKLDGLKIEVPFAEGVDVQSLTKGDKSPMFVVVEAVNDTISKGKRRYTPEVIHEIARQINENKPDGYDGHMKDEDRPFLRPKSQTLWLGAIAKEVDGKLRLFVKGYVFAYAKELRQYLKASKATGKKVAVSIYGQAQHVWNKTISAYDLTDFHLESIDWARSGAEGVPSLGYLAVASEMEGDKLTLESLKKTNPELVAEMESEIRNKIVSEMEDETTKTISEMTNEITNLKKSQVDNYIDNTLKSRVVSETARKVIKSIVVREIGDELDLVKVAEMIGAILRLDETKAIVREMSNTQVVLNPMIDNRKTGDTRRFTVIK